MSALVVGIEKVVVAGSNEFGPFFWWGVFLGADFIWIDGGTLGGVLVGEFHKKAVGRRVWREEAGTFGSASFSGVCPESCWSCKERNALGLPTSLCSLTRAHLLPKTLSSPFQPSC